MNVEVTDATNTVEVTGSQSVVVSGAVAQVVVSDVGVQGPQGLTGIAYLASSFAETTTSNTTAETTVATYSLSSVAPNELYRFVLNGLVSNSSGGTVGYTWRVRLGGTALVGGSLNFGGTTTNAAFGMDADLWIVNATNQFSQNTLYRFSRSVNPTYNQVTTYRNAAYSTVDLTSPQPFELTVQMNTANANATFTIYSWYLTKVNP